MSRNLEPEVVERNQKVWTGNLYYRLPGTVRRETRRGEEQESNRERCERKFQAMKESNPENIAQDVTLDEVIRTILPEGRRAAFYVSRASLGSRDDFECTIPKCPLKESRPHCAMRHEQMPILLLRSQCDSPSLDALFPGNKTLAFRVQLRECPQKGCVLEIIDVIWVSKREKMPFEEEIEVVVHRDTPKTTRSNNLFQASFLLKLPIISDETQNQLIKYANYLVWSTRLSQSQKGGLRYTGYEVDAEKQEVSFFVLSENPEKYRWLQIRKNAEDIEIVPLDASSDRWNFNMLEQEEIFRKKIRNFPLGECKNVGELKPKDPAREEDCPWKEPVGTRVVFELTEKQIEKIQDKNLFPDEGFLCKSTRGTERLNKRLREGIRKMSRTGGEGAPWLAYYLNNMQNALVPTPEEKAQPIEFFNKNLNDDQKRAVEVAVRAPEIALIQGPPGTGKTTVAGEITRQYVAKKKRVLAVSQSGAAVDNMQDRLPLDPSLRVFRILSKNHEQREKDEPSRYSREKTLETFYKSLQTGPKQRLEDRKTREEQTRQLQEFEEAFQNIQGRISSERDRMRGAQDERNRLQGELSRTENQQKENRIQNVIRDATERFVACLREKRFGELEEGLRLQNIVYSKFEEIIQPKLNEFQKVEIGFGTFYDSAWEEGQKTTSIVQKLRDFQDFQTNKLPKLREDYGKLRQLGSNEVSLNENATELHSIQAQMKQLEAEMDRAIDEEPGRMEELERKMRELRARKRALSQNSGLSRTSYEEIFNLPQTTGEGGIAASLTAPGLSRADLLSRFKNLFGLIDSLNKQAEAALNQFVTECEKHLAETQVLPTLEREIARLNRQIDEQNETLLKIQELWETLLQPQVNEAVSALNEQFHVNFQNLKAASDWCRETNRQNQELLQNSAEIWSKIEPFLKDCTQILEEPTLENDDALREKYIQSCSVVGITCTADFRELDRYGYFDVVLVDEVSKAMLPELLIPMLKAEKCILIGDHRQLPPLFNDREPLTMEEIVQRDEEDDSIPEEVKISRESFSQNKELVEASYFKQMFQKAPEALKASLFTQYRMHPEIMRVVNEFYDGKLESGFTGPEEQIRPHHQSREKVPYLQKEHHVYWVDSTKTPDGHFFREHQAGTSKTNPLEVALIVQTMQDLDAGLDGTGQKKSVGIIAFYYFQKKLLRKELRKYQFRNLEYKVETVDRFQGQEKDYILVSMTRNVHFKSGYRKSKNAYVAQFERINVAFSRARELLMIFGASQMFRDYEITLESLLHPGQFKNLKVYRQIMDYIRGKNCFIGSNQIISPVQWSKIRPLENR